MHICFVTDSFLPYCSGVTYAIINQAIELQRRGHQISILRAKPARRDRFIRDELPASIQVHDVPISVPAPRVPKLRLAIPTFITSLGKLRRLRPDVVHVVTEWGCGWEGLISARLLGIPVVGTFHTLFAEPGYLKAIGLPDYAIVRKLMWWYSTFFFSRCRALTSPSATVRQALLQHGVRREPVLISNGIHLPQHVDDERVRALRNQYGIHAPAFIYTGRLSPEKSLDVLLAAFRQVLNARPKAQLVVIGDGPLREQFQRQIQALNIDQQVICLGFIPHDRLIAEHLPRLGDVFVTASTTENQPISILEALAFGVPVVGPRAKGIPELITDGANGLLFAPGAVDHMARCMLELFDDAPRRAVLSEGALRTAADHSLERVGEKLEQFYAAAIGYSCSVSPERTHGAGVSAAARQAKSNVVS